MRSLISAAAILSVFLLAPAQAQQGNADRSVQLRWKFNSGERLGVLMTQDMTTEMDIAGQMIATKVLSKTWMQWQTKQVGADGTATIQSEVSRVLMEMDNPLVGSFVVDTDKEPAADGQAAEIDKMMRPMVGVKMTNAMAPSGKVSDVKIPEEALAGIQGALGGAFMSADQISQMVQNVSPVFPDKALTPGDSWTSQAEIATPAGVMKTDTKYTYQGVIQIEDREMHQIDIETTMAFESPDGAPGIEISDQNSSGVMLFDNEKGRLNRSDLEQKFTIKVAIAPGQVMEQRMTQKVSNVISDLN